MKTCSALRNHYLTNYSTCNTRNQLIFCFVNQIKCNGKVRTCYLFQMIILSYTLQVLKNCRYSLKPSLALISSAVIPSNQIFQEHSFSAGKAMQMLLRRGKWRVSKAFLAPHLNLPCGWLFSFVQWATILRIFPYCFHQATERSPAI